MRSIILSEPNKLSMSSIEEVDGPGPEEVVVEIQRVGICGTDLHAYQGRQPFFSYPRILGHELGVRVLQTGDQVTRVKKGDRCAVIPYLHCGHCLPCKMGKTNCCTALAVLGVHTDGGMRSRMVLPGDKLLPSSILSFEQLALVETLGIGAHAVQRAALSPGENVLIIGAGPIGLSVLEFAIPTGVNIILMERSDKRRHFCQSNYKLSAVIDSSEHAEKQLREMLNGDLPTAVFDATGNVHSMNQAHEFVSSGGRLIYVGFTQEHVAFKSSEFHRREMTLISSRNAQKKDLEQVMQQIENGAIDTSSWITHKSNAEDLITDFPKWIDPNFGVIKAVLDMTE